MRAMMRTAILICENCVGIYMRRRITRVVAVGRRHEDQSHQDLHALHALVPNARSLGGTDGSSWGIHWTMQYENPNIVDAMGKRQIASHYYPIIGPYDSTDPNVLEYHMLLMKYSGIDGVMIDWYGQQGANGDIGSLLTASNE